jgi:hypothetical protein
MQRLTFCSRMSAGGNSSLADPADTPARQQPAPVIR